MTKYRLCKISSGKPLNKQIATTSTNSNNKLWKGGRKIWLPEFIHCNIQKVQFSATTEPWGSIVAWSIYRK